MEDATAVCSAQGWRLIDLPPDKGTSAFKITDADEQMAANFHRGNLGKFIAKVQAGEISKGSVLVIERLDRFSRNYWDIVFPIWVELLQSGIEIYSCVSKTHYTHDAIRKNPMLASMALMEMAMANDYSANLSNRISKAFKIRLDDCSTGLKMNLGAWQPAWIDFNGKKGHPGTFTLNSKAVIVKEIVFRYIAGESMYGIAQKLNDRNEPTLTGRNEWRQGHVHHILSTTTLMGDVSIKGQTFKGYYPPVVTLDEWTKLQSRLHDNKNRKGSGTIIANLFRNRVKCSVCGHTVSAQNCKGYYVYYCLNHRYNKTKCKVASTLFTKLIEQDFFGLFMEESPSQLLGKQTSQHSAKIDTLKSTLTELDKTIADVADFIGKLPMAEVSSKLTKLEAQRQATKSELDELNRVMLSSHNAPTAFNTIKQSILKWDSSKQGSRVEGEAMYEFSMAANKMIDELNDADTRKRLLNILPSLVQHLEVDLEKGCYRIKNIAGELSDWREVMD